MLHVGGQTVLLSLRYDELSWDFARPSNERIATCLPCLFLQFAVVENGRRYSKLLQIFSKQVRNEQYRRDLPLLTW